MEWKCCLESLSQICLLSPHGGGVWERSGPFILSSNLQWALGSFILFRSLVITKGLLSHPLPHDFLVPIEMNFYVFSFSKVPRQATGSTPPRDESLRAPCSVLRPRSCGDTACLRTNLLLSRCGTAASWCSLSISSPSKLKAWTGSQCAACVRFHKMNRISFRALLLSEASGVACGSYMSPKELLLLSHVSYMGVLKCL